MFKLMALVIILINYLVSNAFGTTYKYSCGNDDIGAGEGI